MSVIDHESEIGLRVVFPGIDPVADIIAVPGLGANPHYTWVKKVPAQDKSGHVQHVMWLKDLLPQVIPNARVLKYNYDSNYLVNSRKQDLRSIAQRLINIIHEQRTREPDTTDRPIIFIGHSFGGIVIQEALLVAHRDELTKLQYIAQRTCGVLFLGTPHRGSNVTSMGKFITYFASALNLSPDDQLLHTLEAGSERLRLLLNDFTIVAKTLEMRLVCFYELRETAMMRRYGLGNFFKCIVVNESSATIEGYKSLPLDLDHSELNKFGSIEDEGFRLVSSELRDLVKGGQDLIRERAILVSRKQYFVVPYPENENFVPRDGPYGQLSRLIQDQNSGRQLRIAIIGLGGIGKTQIAMRLAYQYKPTSNVFWIHGSTRDNFIQNYCEIARGVGLLVNTGAEEEIVRSLKNWLDSDVSGQWLMIIDNADDLGPDMLKLFRSTLPMCRGTLIFTTRDSLIVGSGSLVLERHAIRLGVMNNSESKATFLKLSGIEYDNKATDNSGRGPESNPHPDSNATFDQQISSLVELLGNLPLAISQAASYIKQKHISVDKYIDLYQAGEEKQAKLLSDPIMVQEQYDGVPKSVMQTWDITFNQLSKDSIRLLQIMSLLDIQNIPRSLLDSEIVRSELQCQDEIDLDRVMEPLLSFSIVSVSGGRIRDNEGYCYHMHRLVGLWTRNRMEFRTEVIRLTLQLMLAAFPQKTSMYTKECFMLLSHALSILSHSEPYMHMHSEVKSTRTALELKIAGHYIDIYRLDEAEALLKGCLEFYSQLYGDEHEEVCRCMAYLGSLLEHRGSYSEALGWLERALSGRHKTPGKDDLLTLEIANLTAIVFWRQGQFTKALEWYERTLKGRENFLGKDHPDTLSIVYNMGILFSDQGQVLKALEWYERALKGYENVFGKDHPYSLDTVNNMALLFQNQGQPDKAMEWYKRALKGKENVFGKGHPSTLATVYNMAFIFETQGEVTKALEWYQIALNGEEKVLGVDHPTTLTTLNKVAFILDIQGQYSEALNLRKRALTGKERSLGKDHQETLKALYYVVNLELRLQPPQPSGDLVSRLFSSKYMTCKACLQSISGTWYICRVCRWIEFCEQCFNNDSAAKQHCSHRVIRITTDNEVAILPRDGQSVTH